MDIPDSKKRVIWLAKYFRPVQKYPLEHPEECGENVCYLRVFFEIV
jgi:hypothetical protein